MVNYLNYVFNNLFLFEYIMFVKPFFPSVSFDSEEVTVKESERKKLHRKPKLQKKENLRVILLLVISKMIFRKSF